MKYKISKEVCQRGNKIVAVGDRVVADIRFHISAYNGTIEREKLLEALIKENLFCDFLKNGKAELSDGTHVTLIGLQFGNKKQYVRLS